MASLIKFRVFSDHSDGLVLMLSEENSVEDLKLELYQKCSIKPSKQVIEGWANMPENDDTKLKDCCTRGIENNLVLKCSSNDTEMNGKTCDSEETTPQLLEIESSLSFIDKVRRAATSSLFHFCSLRDAIEEACRAPINKRKVLLLFLYNGQEEFSKTFLNCLENDDLSEPLRSYFLIGWDVEQTKYHSALIDALKNYMELMDLAVLVEKKTSAAIFIISVDNNISIASCLRGNIKKNDILYALRNIRDSWNTESQQELKLEAIQEKTGHQFDIGSKEFQTLMADMLGDRDYDHFEHDQINLLKQKIGFALKGPPQSEKGYDKEDKDIKFIFDIIVRESNLIAQYKDVVEIAFIYNCTEPLPTKKVSKSEKAAKKGFEYNPRTDFNPRPIFVLRKCHESKNPCRVFIDDTGRVYQSWTNYIKYNKLPECCMILPRNGKYEVNEDGVVFLERYLSPACGIDVKILMGTDIAATVGGVVSGSIFVAAVIPAIAVAPVALVAAGVTGALVGVYSLGRSIHTLVDRGRHKESLSFWNSESRGAYISILAGTLGFFGAGANLAVSQLAARGVNIAQGARTTVTVLNVVNVTTGGACVLNSGYDMFDQWYNRNQAPSLLSIVQLSSSILFFGNAIYNFRTGTVIVEEAQQQSMQDFQESLRSNRHRKTFNKLYKATLSEQGDVIKARAEVISTMQNIQNKDEVFAVLTRTNRAMNENGIKFTADGGEIKLNGVSVDMGTYASMSKPQVEVFLGKLAEGAIKSDKVNSPISANSQSVQNIPKLVWSKCCDTVSAVDVILVMQKVMNFANADTKEKISLVLECVLNVTNQFVMRKLQEIFGGPLQLLMELVLMIVKYFSEIAVKYEEKYQKWKKTDDKYYYEPLFDNINVSRVTVSIQIFELVVATCVGNGHVSKKILDDVIKYFNAWFTKKVVGSEMQQETEERRRIHSAGWRMQSVKCSECGGHYFYE